MNNIRTISYRKNKCGTPILSKADIDDYAELLIRDFDGTLLDKPTPTPIEDFVELYLNLSVDYHNLSEDKSVLGMLTFNDGVVEVYDDLDRKKYIEVEEGTVFIDNLLLSDEQNGRYRFTFGHEPGHWLFHRHKYSIMKGQMSIFDMMGEKQEISCKCLKRDIGFISQQNGGFQTEDEWMEWQADYFSSAILMPKSTFKNAINEMLENLKINKEEFLLKKPSDT